MSEHPKLTNSEIILEEFQQDHATSTSRTDRQLCRSNMPRSA